MTVAELRSRLEGLPDDMLVCLEMSLDDGDTVGSEAHLTTVLEAGADRWLVIWGDQGVDNEDEGE